MATMNLVVLAGNLTRDPELRFTPSGAAVCNFGIAVNEFKKEGEPAVHFFNCVAWAKTAELVAEHLKKGSGVLLNGRLQYRSWETQEGAKRTAIEVVAQNVQFLPRAPKEGSGAPAAAPSEGPPDDLDEIDLGDDIPF